MYHAPNSVACSLRGGSLRPDQDRPGRGDGMPDFAAPDQVGRTQTLKSIMGPKGAMLVFFRSADW